MIEQMKWAGGEDACIGDVFGWCGNEWVITGTAYVFNGLRVMPCARPGDGKVSHFHPKHFDLLRRQSPMTIALGTVITDRPILGKDRNGRDVRNGDVLRCMCGQNACQFPNGGLVASKYEVGWECFEDASGFDITLSHAELVTDEATPKPEPIVAPPLVDAESLAATQRDKHRLEAAALQERYAAFRSTVERVVAEDAPAARVVTDVGLTRFTAWLDFGGVRSVVHCNIHETSFGHVALDVDHAIADARTALGDRVLRGEKAVSR